MTAFAPQASVPIATSAAITRLLRDFGASQVTPETLDGWAAQAAHSVLLLAGDPVRFPEGQDVAAVLPELCKAAGTACQIGVLARAHEDAIAQRFGSQRWPMLLFFSQGQYAGALSGMHDWQPFAERFAQALAAAPRRVPGVGIPVVAQEVAQGAAGACGSKD